MASWIKIYPTNVKWSSIACDSTGQYLVSGIVGYGGIYTSSSYGNYWTKTSAPDVNTPINASWDPIVSDYSGKYLVALGFDGGQNKTYILTSSSYGNNWIQTITNGYWNGITSDSTGQYLAVIAGNNGVYTTNNYGSTWILTSAPNNANWNSITGNATGQYLAVASYYGYLYTSSTYGVYWNKKTVNNVTNVSWNNITCDSTGKYITVASSNIIYTSSSYGTYWNNISLSGINGDNFIVANATGQYLVYSGNDTTTFSALLYLSSTYGANWNIQTINTGLSWVSWDQGIINSTGNFFALTGSDLQSNRFIYTLNNIPPTPTITPAATQNVTYPQTTSTTLTATSNSTGALTYYLSTSGATTFGNASITTSSSTGIVGGTTWVAGGLGTNSLAYSNDGLTWTGITGKSVFSSWGYGAAWNGTMWVAVGNGTSNIAYSNDGVIWTGLGNTIFLNGMGYRVAWNGTRWVAVGGGGTNSIAYSDNGTTWTGLGMIFSTVGYGVSWNGTIWVAVGQGSNSIAYSNDGLIWTGVTLKTIFSSAGDDVAWNGTRWVAVGEGTSYTIAYSNDGIAWTGVTGSTSILSGGYGLAWNGTKWVALGTGTSYTIAYSNDGISWNGITNSTSIFAAGNDLAWNGSRWVAVGEGTNTIAYSNDGITWTGMGKSIFLNAGLRIASNATNTTSYTANVSITGPGSINTFVTQAASGNYAAITTPVTAGTINVQGSPTITPATTQSVAYPTITSLPITPTSTSTGAFTFSLQPGFPAGTSIDSATGVLTIGGLGTINVLVTQDAAGIYVAVTTPVAAGTINVVAPTAPTITPDNRTVSYPTTQTFTVTNNGAGSYTIDGNNNPTLNLFRGITYNFDLNASGHPFWIKTTATTDTTNQYNDGVTNNGTQSGRITFSVPLNAPNVIYYICQYHSSMQGIINISDFGTTITPTSNSTGAFTFSLQSGFPAGTSINSSTGVVTIGGTGTINVLVTQAASGIYSAVTTPVDAGTITVTSAPSPTITPAANQTVIYPATTSVTVTPTSNSSGAFTFSLQVGSPAGTSINSTTGVVTIGGLGTINVLVTQAADSNYAAITTPVSVCTITVSPPKTATVTPISDSPGAFTYSLDASSNTIASINSSTGVVTINSGGTINVYVTQAASGNYDAVTTPVLAGSIISISTPTITPAATQNATYGQPSKVNVTPTSNSTGAFTFSLQPGYLGCTTVDPNTGVVTIGGTGTITVLVTQAATSNYGPVTTPVLAGTIISDFSPIPCFKENTLILTVDGYRPIQDLRKGDLVKTVNHGYVGINTIGCKIIYNRKETIFFDKIYKCSNDNYPEIFEDLYITGLHAVLVDKLTDEQLTQIKCVYNDNIFITDDKYRLPVCFDERANPHNTEEDEEVVIFHLALDHENENLNYGIFANGLLVETTSIELMKESGLIMVE